MTTLPQFIGDLGYDKAALQDAAAECGRVLAELGPVAGRDDAQAARAAQALDALRAQRRAFLRAHLHEVYLAATDNLRESPRLTELAAAVTTLFPGLLPDPGQLAADAAAVQAHKEGWEVDQGIFFHAVFADPIAGNHLLDAMRRPTRRAQALLPDFESTGRITMPAATLTRSGHTATITITNTHCLNAEDNQHVADMETAVDLVLLDDRSKVGVVRGGEMNHPRYRGKRVFSAGINLTRLHQGKISYVEFLLGRETGYIAKILRGLSTLGDSAEWPPRLHTKPWIAAVDTFAIGGGAQLLLVFDRVIAAADSYFSLPAAQEGIVPGAGNLRLGRGSTSRLSREVILWGKRIHATEPAARYVFDSVVEPDAMDTEISRAAEQLAADAVVANKHMIVTAEEPQDTFRSYMAEFALHQALRLYGVDVLAKVGRFSAGARQ
ncbi:enoyl-CoA hydratase/isomerase family protein [Streptomyces gardneri]|uniref:(3,5-dihydroxyphenyl)acetyl-CoA 1,2-dioxygenase DpgC n=1 Tax=Nocardia TaxID=1817 RepID=UPI001892F62E|nr:MULTISPECIES: (3,5-dihydroxyphenyl)acetyl-CoA 1,2-dioxygenase DpgC [Nocardia]MBF6164134.1 enoyl-CoA hydratase/isomerase family protein [Streptomyces gardneri]MBF6203708.1 enoyl-CoA hydratase/isomerase family protein [Streptomyces gardneri]